MNIEQLVKSYNNDGLEEMIQHAQEEIDKKLREREQYSIYWHQEAVDNYQRTIDTEINAINEHIIELKKAIEIKKEEI